MWKINIQERNYSKNKRGWLKEEKEMEGIRVIIIAPKIFTSIKKDYSFWVKNLLTNLE